jgi:hypothetical protein
MLQFHPSNPFRPVAWRWEQARLLREKKIRTAAKTADRHTLMAYKFQLGMEKCKDDVDRWTLMEQYPDLYSAYLIHRRGDDEDRHPLRFALEARLLSGQPEAEISDLLGISTSTVLIYERLFFNVKEKLRHNDYIMTCVLGPSVHAGLSDRDYDLLWKLYGYLYGPAVLDSFISTTSRKFRPETLNEVDAALADDARSALQRKVATVARTFVINPFSQSELLNIYARFLEVEKETNSGKAQDVILQNIQVMLDKLPWQSGGETIAANPHIADYDKSAMELRTEELLQVSVGKAITDAPETNGLTFPEPITHAKPISK